MPKIEPGETPPKGVRDFDEWRERKYMGQLGCGTCGRTICGCNLELRDDRNGGTTYDYDRR